jgi:leader peptidase (prepilin peptidase)/N-methyltransferase
MSPKASMPRLMRSAAGAAVVASGIAALSLYALPARLAAISCLLGWAMLAIAVIDWRSYTIPDVLSLPAIPLGLLASGALVDPARDHLVSLDHVIGAGLGAASFWLVREGYWRLRRREGLGLGDVKLAAAGGAWTGWEQLADVVLLAAAAALAFAAVLAIAGRMTLTSSDRIPFGTFLAPAIWAAWLLHAVAQVS